MIRAKSLIALFKQTLNEQWGYIWGTAGETWTQEKQDEATRELTIEYGQKWVGRRVADCSGLFYWAFKQLGGYMYHGSNTMFRKYSISSGELRNGNRSDGKTLKPGTALYKYNAADGYHHVGLYVGNNTVIEAKGTAYGVVSSKPSDGWTHWAELKGVDYDEGGNDMTILYTATVTTSSGTLNVRMEASKKSEIVGRLSKGKTVNVVEEGDGWLRVQYGDLEGWCSADYLTKDENEGAEGKEEAESQEETGSLLITDSEGNTFVPVGDFTVRKVVD